MKKVTWEDFKAAIDNVLKGKNPDVRLIDFKPELMIKKIRGPLTIHIRYNEDGNKDGELTIF